jgi:hypothetical protein
LALVIGAACTCGEEEEEVVVMETPTPGLFDPEEYQPNRIDDAFHGLSSPYAHELWYFSAVFDNGYSMVNRWRMGAVMSETGREDVEFRAVGLVVYDPDGKETSTEAQFPDSEVFASIETCDVRMGDNHLHGEFPRWEMHFRIGDVGGDFVFENLTQGFRQPPDGVGASGAGWVIAQPRARVSGKLILDGEEIPVSGEGYHDHVWGVSTPEEGLGMLDHWNWGRLFLPDHTFIFNVAQLTEKLGSLSGGVLIAFKGEELFQATMGIVAEPSDFELDEVSGLEYPRKLVLKIDDPMINGEVILTVRRLLDSLAPEGPEGYYFYFQSDCEVRLDVDGEKVELDVQGQMHELMKPWE